MNNLATGLPLETGADVRRTGLPSDAHALAPGRDVDAAFVIYRLEEAGSTLLALPGTGYSTRLAATHLAVVQDVCQAYSSEGRIRPPVPSAARISRMDEALGWVALIPQDRFVLRRIVGARSLVSPVTERHLFSWRRLGTVMGADHKAVQRWHAQGIQVLVTALAGRVRQLAFRADAVTEMSV